MELKHCTIEIDAEELETIGNALCMAITTTLKDFTDKDVDVDDWIQEYRTLLFSLTNAGYHLWVDGTDVFSGYHTIDVDDWITKEKAKLKKKSLGKSWDSLIKRAKKLPK